VKHTFEYQPIETAPTGRAILLWCPSRGLWRWGKWDSQEFHKKPMPYWNTYASVKSQDYSDQPTFWAEIQALVPEVPHV
jgi:hypothetical protein